MVQMDRDNPMRSEGWLTKDDMSNGGVFWECSHSDIVIVCVWRPHPLQ